jgi:hypothetical protein
MKNISIRAAQPGDECTYSAWLEAAREINLIDPAVYTYPTCNTLVVEKADEPILMNSFHLVVMVEALAPKPGLSPMDEARALKTLFDSVEQGAKASGIKEIWFGCKDPRVQKFVQRHGIEQVAFPMFRMRLK